MTETKETASLSPYLTPAELATRWKVTPMTLRRWRKAGKFSVLHMGRGIRIAATEVERLEREAKA